MGRPMDEAAGEPSDDSDEAAGEPSDDSDEAAGEPSDDSDDSDELDNYLKELAEKAKRHNIGSEDRNVAVTRLLFAIENSGKLYCQGKRSCPEAYDNAMQAVRLYVFRSIDRYDPSRARMMTWVNQKLKFEFQSAFQEIQKAQQLEKSLSERVGSQDDGSYKTLEEIVMSEDNPFLSERIRKIIEEDPEGYFQNKQIAGYPEANFRAICLYQMDNVNKREMARRWNIPEQTLYSFFRRACREFKPLIEKYLRES